MKRPPAGGRRTPVWGWILGIPLIGLFVVALFAFLYINYLDPKVGMGVHAVRAEVLDKVEKTRPDGTLDAVASYLLVRVEGHELKLAARPEAWAAVTRGDTVEVEVGRSGAGGLQAFSWKKAAPPR